jgi:type I restriction enzyme, R subunit
MALLREHSLTDLTDYDAFYDVLYDEDLRFDFMLAFKRMTKALNLVFPSRQALEFMGDYTMLAGINVLAGKHFRDQRLSMKGIPAKLRALTDAHLESQGIDVKVPPISILDQDFQKNVGGHRRTKTKATEIEHAIRHHLDVDLDDDPDLKASFAEALAAIFEQFRNNWDKIHKELEKLRQRIINASQEPTYGLHRKKQMPLFRMFQRELFGAGTLSGEHDATKVVEATTPDDMTLDDAISHIVDLTQKVFLVVERELRLTGFWEAIPARNKLRAEIQNVLLAPEFSSLPGLRKKRSHLVSRVMEISEKNNDVILFAE